MTRVLGKHPEVHAVMLGDGPLRGEVQREVRSLLPDGRLHLLGYRSDADSWLAAAHIVTLSSAEEGLGSVLLDALAFGKPIAATSAGGIPEVVEDGVSGLLSPPGDPAALGAAVDRLLSDTALARSCADEARKRAQRFSEQNEKTAIYGVIGSPVSHSLSPLIHNTAFAHHEINAVYVPFRVEDTASFWRSCGSWIAGLSITIPHKQAMINQMFTIEDLAQRIGAINTVYRDRDLKPVGANTDAYAVIHCLEEQIGELRGRQVLVLGAGGVARAIGVALHERGAVVTIANRTSEKAKALAEEIGAHFITLDKAETVPFDVLINGTASGMGNESESPWPEKSHRETAVVFDTVYHPLETKLLRDAQRAGSRTVSGLEMLVRQALGQYQRWTGREAPQHLMYRACLDRLGATHS
jgi:shikimate dehydrogenase